MKMMKCVLAASAALLLSSLANAGAIMPNFDGAPAGWNVDRYAPDGFSDIGTYQGRNDVIAATVGPNGDASNRPSGMQGGFYDTQGMSHTISGGAGDWMSAGLWVEDSWLNPAQGLVSTGLWGAMNQNPLCGPDPTCGYPILNLTNFGANGFIGFRTWDDTNGVYHNVMSLAGATNGAAGGRWYDLSIFFSGDKYVYGVDGSVVDIISSDPLVTGFNRAFLQVFNDPNSSGSVTAHWSNSNVVATVPEPATLSMLGMGLAGIVGARRRSRNRKDGRLSLGPVAA